MNRYSIVTVRCENMDVSEKSDGRKAKRQWSGGRVCSRPAQNEHGTTGTLAAPKRFTIIIQAEQGKPYADRQRAEDDAKSECLGVMPRIARMGNPKGCRLASGWERMELSDYHES